MPVAFHAEEGTSHRAFLSPNRKRRAVKVNPNE
jgi:hypothetical protein